MKSSWPVVDGAYAVGDPDAPVAVCTLTSERLVEPVSRLSGVAIAGQVYTANLGIERIVTNLTANPAIRFLLLCGKDSKIFRPGQSLAALLENGVDAEGRIIGATGYDPVLPLLPAAQVGFFRQQIELIDQTGDDDIDALQANISELAARAPGRFTADGKDVPAPAAEPAAPERFVTIRPGGQKVPLQYDPRGYFVITLDREEEQIVLRHYLPDHTPAHEMRGRGATAMFLGLVREGLVSQLSHAGYLGEELAKAEAALRLELRYAQDRPLKRMETAPPVAAPPPSMPRVQPGLTRKQLLTAVEGAEVSVALAVTDRPSETEISGTLLEPGARDPFSSFTRTDHRLDVVTTGRTKTAMGDPSDIVAGAIIRVRGVLLSEARVEAQGVAILTGVATVQ